MFSFKNQSNLSIFLALLICIATTSCKKKKQVVNKPDFNQYHAAYISAYSSGQLARNSAIQIRFTADVSPVPHMQTTFDNNLIKFRPKIAGKLKWVDRRTLEFTPEKMLDGSQVYNAELDLKTIYDTVPNGLRYFPFQFNTAVQSFNIDKQVLEPMQFNNGRLQSLTGNITLHDAEEEAKVEKLLKVQFEGKDLKVKWNNYGGLQHYFVVDSIPRKAVTDSIKISWDGEAIGYKFTSQSWIKISALSEFSLTNINNTSNPEPVITLEYSDPLDPQQDLTGLITAKGINFTFDINGGTITAYPDVKPGRNLKLFVSEGLKNIHGYKINRSATYDLTFEEIKPAIRAVGQGNIIPHSNDNIPFPFEAVNLNAVDVQIIKIYERNILQFMQRHSLDDRDEGEYYNYENLEYVGKVIYEKKIELDDDPKMDLHSWNKHVLDLSKLINAEPGAIYSVNIRFRRAYSIYTCVEKYLEPEEKNDIIIREKPKTLWDYYENYEYDYDYNSEDACKDYYYQSNQGISKNILASDLGIIAKRSESGNMLVAINNLLTTQPIPNALIEVYDLQQQKLKNITANENGIAQFDLKEEPFVIVAKAGNQRGYLKMRNTNPLSLSRFEVEGTNHKKGVKGFIYGDRGVWRPGDSIYITFLLEDKKHAFPANHPVIFELYNPTGQLVQKLVKNASVNGFYTFPTATELNAPTGNYEAQINVGGAVFNKTLIVETVIPNRLKLNLKFDKDYVTAKDSDIGNLNVKWLHGAVAKSLPVEISAGFRQLENPFPNYKDYIFQDPEKEISSDAGVLLNGKLDADGNIKIPNNLGITEASGPLKLKLYGKVTEPGGSFSTDNFSTIYHPYEKYVGLRVPQGEGEPGILLTEKMHSFDIVLLDKSGKPADGEVDVKLYKLNWRWWYDYNEDESGYNSRQYNDAVISDKVQVKNGKAQWKLKMQKDDYGRYQLEIANENGHKTGKIIYIDNPNWYARVDEDNAEGTTLLRFSSNKKSYKTGEQAFINIPAGYNGMALVTIESATKILKAEWIKTTEKNTNYAFTVSPEMSPNAYVSVTLMQPHAKTENDLPIRLFGVIPVQVDNPASHINPVLKMPEVIKPESTVNLMVSESSGRPMTYTIAMVDEGLLDLTHFQTPEPWKYFNEKEALQVSTWDIYDLVLGNHIGKLKKMLSIGGDEYNRNADATRLQRFKPMVKFLGPFTLAAGKTRVHKIYIPRYIGSVRTMLIAADNGAYGNTEVTTAIRSPLMVLGTLPRVLRPNEEVDLPVSVFAMEDFVKDVKIEIRTNDLLESKGLVTQNLKFTTKGEQTINFPLKVKAAMGIASVEITATSGKQKAKYNIGLQVHAPNPVEFRNSETIIGSGKSQVFTYESFGINGTNKGSVEISSIPTINLESRLEYLIQYPHGCIEQTTSSVFPQLYVYDLMKLDDAKKMQIQNNIKAGIQRIRMFQLPEGGFSYWPNESYDEASAWGTNYAGHFLLEAQKHGYQVPSDLLLKWRNFQKERANNWSQTYTNNTYNADEEEDALSQAYRLYLLAQMRAPELGAMNRLREINIPVTAKWLLAAAYFKSGQKTVAEQITKVLPLNVGAYRELGNNYGSDFRDEAIILEVLDQLGRDKDAFKLTKQISQVLKSEKWLSTQETAYGLMAVTKSGTSKGSSKISIEYRTNNGKWQTLQSDKPLLKLAIDLKSNPKSFIEIKNMASANCYSNVVIQGIPYAGKEKNEQKNLSLKVDYLDRQGRKLDPLKLEQGTDFYAEIHITNPGTYKQIDELALTAMFPSGWQIYNPRMTEGQFPVATSQPEYMDIRDDRVYFYFDLKPPIANSSQNEENTRQEERSNSKVFRIALNASYTGRFYLPSVSLEAMYDKGIRATVAGKWVSVVKQPVSKLANK